MTHKPHAEAAAFAAAQRDDDGDDAEAREPTPATEPEEASNSGGGPASPPPETGAPEQAELDLDELAAKAEKADEYLALAQRTRADFENYRKRAAREAALAQERGVARLTKELLPAIDNLDRALQAAADEDPESQLVSGIKLVHAEVLAALSRAGIEPFSPVGEAFDPQWHEAVAQIPVPGAESGTVVEVYQQGYRLGETVLRAARVLVAA